MIRRIAGNGLPAEEIAEMTDLSLDTVLRMIGTDDFAEQSDNRLAIDLAGRCPPALQLSAWACRVRGAFLFGLRSCSGQ